MTNKVTYTICMDESGKFEEKEDKARFLGGLIYKGDDFKAEEERIKVRFEKIAECITVKLRSKNKNFTGKILFPVSFHMSHIRIADANDVLRDAVPEESALIKNEIIGQFLEFLKPQVSFARRGGYELFMMIDPSGKARSFESNQVWDRFNMTKLSDPGNLYVRLATLTVANMVFYFLKDDMKSAHFMLASRTPFAEGQDVRKVSALFRIQQEGKRTYYSQVDTGTFVAALQNKIYEGNAVLNTVPGEVSFHVDSLDYGGKKEISPFYYLSDIICLALQRRLYRFSSYEQFEVSAELLERVRQSFGDSGFPAYIWTYENTDMLWQKALDYFAEGELVKGWELLYDIIDDAESVSGRFYKKFWIPEAEHWVEKNYISAAPLSSEAKELQTKLPGYLEYLNEILHSSKPDKIKWIADHLKNLMRQRNVREEKLWYRIYDILLRCCNHQGNIRGTEACLVQLNRYCGAVAGEEYLASINRVLQWYFNRFSYQGLLKIGETVTRFEEEKNELSRKEMQEISSLMSQWEDCDFQETPLSQNRSLGVTYSSLGQAYSYLRMYGEAEQCFIKALKQFPCGGRDYHQTLNYRMHAFIQAGKEKEYERQEEQFFGNLNPETQLRKMVPLSKEVKMEYAGYDLFVWIKGIYCFGKDAKSYKKAVKNLVREIKGRWNAIHLSMHPWALVLKYLYLYGKRTRCLDEDVLVEIQEKFQTEIMSDLTKQIKQERWGTLETVNSAAAFAILTDEQKCSIWEKVRGMMLYRDTDIWPDFPVENIGQAETYFREHLTYMYQ